MTYAADSPIELAPNLKGLFITLIHGDADTWVSHQQSRKMSQTLNDLGYPHFWKEIPGQDHEPITSYQINPTFEQLETAFGTPYSPPVAWRYRVADDLTRQVYDTVLTKTNPLVWTEVMSVTASGFDTASGDAFSLMTAPLYTPLASYTVAVIDLLEGGSTYSHVIADVNGRLSLAILAGQHRVLVQPKSVTAWAFLPLVFRWF